MDGLDNTSIAAEAKFSVNFTNLETMWLILYYNADKSFLYTNGLNIQQFKVKNSEMKP